MNTTKRNRVELRRNYENHIWTEMAGTPKRKVKLKRAQGECLGIRSRRRTRPAAKSCGELQANSDPQISEWSNPAEQYSVTVY